MSTNAVLGKVAGKRTRNTEHFIDQFVDSITREEWIAISQLQAIRQVTQLVAVVCIMRSIPKRELPAGHPLGATT
jgi:hypothetical protein